MTPTVELEHDSIRVRFGDILHLHLKRSKLLAVHSWRFQRNFSIEFTLVGGVVVSEYDDETKWLAILSGLEKIL